MKGGKFVVIKLRELIKTAVFAVMGVIIIAGFIWFFINLGGGDGQKEYGNYKDGTYYTKVALGEENAMVKVAIEQGNIADITLDGFSDTAMVFYPLLEPALEEVAREVIKTQSFEISVSNQNVYSAQAILQGVATALEQAKIQE